MIKKKAKTKKPSAKKKVVKKKVVKKKVIKKMKKGGDTNPPPKGFKYPKSVQSAADSAAYASGYGYDPVGGGYAGITSNKNYRAGKLAKVAVNAAAGAGKKIRKK